MPVRIQNQIIVPINDRHDQGIMQRVRWVGYLGKLILQERLSVAPHSCCLDGSGRIRRNRCGSFT